MRRSALLAALCLLCPSAISADPAGGRLNVLLITADDLNYDSLGFTGSKVPAVSPNIDRLSGEGMRFEKAHVTVAVCQPSRSVMMTGRYPHRSGALGFQPITADVPTLSGVLHDAGWQTGIFGKETHLRPIEQFKWDVFVHGEELGMGRDAKKYHQAAKDFFEKAKAAGKPFFLMANSQDPHRPFAGSEQEETFRKNDAAKAARRNAAGRPGRRKAGNSPAAPDSEEEGGGGDYPPVTNAYRPEQVVVPGFLPDLPDVRREVAQYFTSVRRCDETVGEVLRALDETGFRDTTLVVFLSDHGMAFPYSKTNCYFTSTRTPLVVRWPGKVKPGAVDANHFTSGVDLTPTILEAAGLPLPGGLDGRSILPLLRGEAQEGREKVLTFFYRTVGKRDYWMRCLRDSRYAYLYNAWSDGKTAFQNESMSGLTFKAMQAAGEKDPAVAARVEFFLHRVPEELYDDAADPDNLKNLIGDPAQKDRVETMRRAMLAELERIGDPLAADFKKRFGL